MHTPTPTLSSTSDAPPSLVPTLHLDVPIASTSCANVSFHGPVGSVHIHGAPDVSAPPDEPTLEPPEPTQKPTSRGSATPVSDSPHVQRAMTKLERVLRRVQSKKQTRNASGKSSRSTFSTEFQLGLGRSCGALGAKSFETPHNFKRGVGVYMQDIQTSRRPRWQRALWVAAKELLLEIDPDFAEHDDYCVNFSKMTDGSLHWVRKHVDGRDIAHQYGLVLGDSQGGELQVWNSDGTSQVVDYRHKVLKMDGRLPHAVLPFEGERYCVIFYKLFDRNMTQPLPIFEPARII